MTDILLTTGDRKASLSLAYVQTVAAAAGYTTQVENFDRRGVDLQICAGGEVHPAVDIQLKSTVNLGVPTSGYYHYRLRVHNYNLLVSRRRFLDCSLCLTCQRTKIDGLLSRLTS